MCNNFVASLLGRRSGFFQLDRALDRKSFSKGLQGGLRFFQELWWRLQFRRDNVTLDTRCFGIHGTFQESSIQRHVVGIFRKHLNVLICQVQHEALNQTFGCFDILVFVVSPILLNFICRLSLFHVNKVWHIFDVTCERDLKKQQGRLLLGFVVHQIMHNVIVWKNGTQCRPRLFGKRRNGHFVSLCQSLLECVQRNVVSFSRVRGENTIGGALTVGARDFLPGHVPKYLYAGTFNGR
mmetsp:Transcript_23634/g.65719  ORF Transcript_23634/g.65719 Transcript_23634/m.65719 type:complete len:238 (-) Transcript_23634:999-1712(-)